MFSAPFYSFFLVGAACLAWNSDRATREARIATLREYLQHVVHVLVLTASLGASFHYAHFTDGNQAKQPVRLTRLGGP